MDLKLEGTNEKCKLVLQLPLRRREKQSSRYTYCKRILPILLTSDEIRYVTIKSGIDSRSFLDDFESWMCICVAVNPHS